MRSRSPFAFLLSAFALLAACGDDAPSDMDAGMDGAIDAALTRCTMNSECDDGLFCNGVEACTDGVCVAAAPIACDDAIDCTIDACNEVTDRCEFLAPDMDEDGVGDITCLDADGEPLGQDCDDADARRFPGNREVCDADGLDEDCDDATFGDTDSDSDGFIDARCRNVDGDTILSQGDDCNDGRRDVNPDGSETCDHLDNDCDGTTDEGVVVSVAVDADRDGFPESPSEPRMECPGFAGLVAIDSDTVFDCDDSTAARNPGQVEVCDEIDNDCDETTDEDAQVVTWFTDRDGDGFGARSSGTTESCEPVDGASLLDTDCNDDEGGINPASAEMCNGIDDDCNGAADFEITLGDYEDDDGDGRADIGCGAPRGVDCDDEDRLTSSGVAETCDGRDNDCDDAIDEGAASAVWFFDADGDGHGTNASAAHPPIAACTAPAGYVASGGDCNDDDGAIRPGATETCNRLDDDCDGAIDEGAGLCDCPGDTFDCDGNGSCETDLSSDEAHCGRCGNSCGTGQTCTAGECACDDATLSACGTSCVDLNNDPAHCGGCDAACGVVSTCEARTCDAIEALHMGPSHSCALTSAGRLACWGNNDSGQVSPDVAAPVVASPVEVDLGGAVVDVALGVDFTCAIIELSAGEPNGVRCWGANDRGQLGYPIGMEPPSGLTTEGTFYAIAAGDHHVCILQNDEFVKKSHGVVEGPAAQVQCWGGNESGQLGRLDAMGEMPDTMDRFGPARVDVVDAPPVAGHTLSLGANFSCVVARGSMESDITCWGANNESQSSLDGVTNDAPSSAGPPRPVFIPGSFSMEVALPASGRAHTCLHRDGQLVCFGGDAEGQYISSGEGLTLQSTPGTVEDLTAAGNGTCIVTDGEVWCRGTMGGGIATGDWTRAMVGRNAQQVACGPSHCCALNRTGHVYCWGDGTSGRLGRGISAPGTFAPGLVSDLTP